MNMKISVVHFVYACKIIVPAIGHTFRWAVRLCIVSVMNKVKFKNLSKGLGGYLS